MDPVLYSYYIPKHDPEVVARNVLRAHLARLAIIKGRKRA